MPLFPGDPNLLTMVSDQKKSLDSSFEELKETVTRLETRVLEIEKENMEPQLAKEKKLPIELSVGSYMYWSNYHAHKFSNRVLSFISLYVLLELI